MGFSAFGTAAWGIHQNRFGQPPTEFSEAAYGNTLRALISLLIVCLFSIIILRGKVHHMSIGYLIMFLYVLTLYFALKGASRAFVSIKYDDIVTIENYIFTKNERTNGELPQFFHRLQRVFKCCGTSHIDKMKDWPVNLQSLDMPRSCCRKVSKNCGKLLGRTAMYSGQPNEAMRMPSGFFLSLTDSEMDGIVQTGKPMKIVYVPAKDKGMNIMLKTIKELYFKKLKEGYPPNTPVKEMKRQPNDIIDPIDIGENVLPSAIGCRDNSAVEKVTTIGWEAQHELDLETSRIYMQSEQIKYNWTAWKIPVCQEIAGQPPFHLANNLNRDFTNVHTGIKQMWYISRGIAENYILKDVLWETYCENEKNFKNHIPTSFLISKFASTKARKHASVGKFFIAFVNQLMLVCFGICSAVVVMLIVVFLVFWHYYSRMKLEEHANLPYPPEFEDLRVRQSDLYIKHEKFEYDKDQVKEHHEEEESEFSQIFGSSNKNSETTLTSKSSVSALRTPKSQFIMYPDDG